jgi:hypothetical protein
MSNIPPTLASKYLLYKTSDNYDTKLDKIKKEIDEKSISRQSATNEKVNISRERNQIENSIGHQQASKTLINKNDDNYREQIELIDKKISELKDKSDEKNSAMVVEQKKIDEYALQIKKLEREMEDVNKDKEILPVVVYAVQVSQNAIQTIIQNSKSRTTLASGELVMVPIVTIYNVLGGKQITDNISISEFQNKLLQLTIGILQQEKIISQIADASQIGNDYYNYDDKERIKELKKCLSEESITEIHDIVKHNIKFMLGIFFSYKNSFSYSGIQYIINSVDWDDKFKQLKVKSKLLKRMNASYYTTLKLFLEKLEPGKLPSDRKGTFLESCGVKGAIIRNEWKNNFESRTFDGWKNVFGFGKKKEDEVKGEGIFDKIVPSFIKNAIKSIKNPLMSPLDPGVLQVSLIQYSLLGEVELQEFYYKIENSFAGVAWKNDNTWEKRKQRLFAAMDECQADIYCFQNVQCSLDVYKNCVNEAVSDETPDVKERRLEILHDINNLSTYRERLILYFNKIHEKLISTHDAEGLNCVSDIYEKYKDSYDFVYFFEQVFYTSHDFDKNHSLNHIGIPNRLYPEYGTKVALGNLTMVKKSKLEIENKLRYDVRIGATFCSETIRKRFYKFFPSFSSTTDKFKDEYASMCRNKSFASMVYIRFKSIADVSTSTSTSTDTLTLEDSPTTDELVEDKMRNEEREFKKDETLQKVLASNVSEDSNAVEAGEAEEDEGGEGGEEEDANNQQAGAQRGGAPSWYDKDTTEVDGYGRLIKKPAPPGTPDSEPLPCFDMKDTLYIPRSDFTSKSLYGICNIKFDTTDISEKQKVGTPSLPKDVMQVILMAVFIYKLRFNMQSYGLRITNLNNNPFIVSGLFRDDMVTGTNNNPKLNTALKLLTTDTTTKWRKNLDNDQNFGKKDGPINKFVINMIILTYLRVGKIRVAGFHPIHKNFNPKLIGDIYPLEQRSGSGSSISELIICCDNFKICNTDPGSDNAMYKMIPAINPNPSLPIFPNNVNPSNSVAIGGVFDITPPDILQHVALINSQIKEGRDADAEAVQKAKIAAVPYEEGAKTSLSDIKKMFPAPALSSSAASSAAGFSSLGSGSSPFSYSTSASSASGFGHFSSSGSGSGPFSSSGSRSAHFS